MGMVWDTGWTHGVSKDLILRHDNGLVFGSWAYRALVKDYSLKQEYFTPYTPEQNGLCEQFIRSFNEKCACLHRFQDVREARAVVARYIEHFNTQRPHQALAYRTPREALLNPHPSTRCLKTLELVQQAGEHYRVPCLVASEIDMLIVT